MEIFQNWQLQLLSGGRERLSKQERSAAAAAAAENVGRPRCSEPEASVMCGGFGIDKDEELKVVREKGSGWRLVKADEAPSHCISPAILTGYR